MAKFEERLLYLNSAEFIIDAKVKYTVTLVMALLLYE